MAVGYVHGYDVWRNRFREKMTVACEVCGCSGNSSCGHWPLGEGMNCTLNEIMVCPCCVVAGGASHLDIPEDGRQQVLDFAMEA